MLFVFRIFIHLHLEFLVQRAFLDKKLEEERNVHWELWDCDVSHRQGIELTKRWFSAAALYSSKLRLRHFCDMNDNV